MAVIPIAPALPPIVPIAPNHNNFSDNSEVYTALAQPRVSTFNSSSVHSGYESSKPIRPVIRSSSLKDNQNIPSQGIITFNNNTFQNLEKTESPIVSGPYMGSSASPSPTPLTPSSHQFGSIQNTHISPSSQQFYPQLGIANRNGLMPQPPISYNTPLSGDVISVSRDWVLPPRPKPGRKPSSDVPPTKRKAQNRAAQRAFRERRAAKVSELEEKLCEVEQEHDDKVQDLSSRLDAANAEIERLNKLLGQLKDEVSSPISDGSFLRNPDSLDQGMKVKEPAKCCSNHSHEKNSENSNTNILNEVAPKTDDDCGLCDKGESCVCDTLGFKASSRSFGSGDANGSLSPGKFQDMDPVAIETELFVMKPMAAVPLKKRPANKSIKNSSIKRFRRLADSDSSLLTTASTSATSSASHSLSLSADESKVGLVTNGNEWSPVPINNDSTHDSPVELDFSTGSKVSPVVDPCGFCSDGTPCLCAEAAANAEKSSFPETVNKDDNRVEVKAVSPSQHPKAKYDKPDSKAKSKSEDSLQLASTKQVVTTSASCSRCQDDPMCTLFCTSLESFYNERGYRKEKSSKKSNYSPGSYISCEAVYKTISRHKAFLSSELGDILSKLESEPDSFDVDDNGNLKVNVTSVAQVLKKLNTT
ncbi:hypothetical protein NADFUDRAFT_51243 [Nadsonia fulvescens var. elongata DSM 6958]|uniref:BZIP domain-containing protein n=1 Tax=Nadsonia fulvescens var. elongata DSM 6958 TaxID=857566 RepID=A0A1E3PM12_9ASCO|nr:hypothetical protein NADFUDRAFT_51243 [Nadsonia fulvescens var. elongata DSM 6958]